MKKEKETVFLLDNNRIIGFEYCCRRAMLGDRIRLKNEPNTTRGSYAKIIDFTDDDSGRYFGVQLETGEYTHVDYAKISEVFPCNK